MTEGEGAMNGDPHSYTVPFDRVWQAMRAILAPERGWTEISADPKAGSILSERRTPLLRRPLQLLVTVSLDADGFTRVEAVFLNPRTNQPARLQHRRARRFFRRLNRALRADRGS